jgi:hypothetical protein
METAQQDQVLDTLVSFADHVIVSSDSCYRELPVIVVLKDGQVTKLACELWHKYDDAVQYVKTVRGETPELDPSWVANNIN